MTHWPRMMLTGSGSQHQPRAGGRGTALGCFAAIKPSTLQHLSVSVPAAIVHTPTAGHGSPAARQRGAASSNTDLSPAEALPLPEPRRWPPYNRRLLQAPIFLQTCTFSAFAAPSCGDSASVQTRGQLRTGRDGTNPSSSSSSGEARGRAAAARPCRRHRGPAASGAA